MSRKRESGFWRAFFGATHAAYKAQREARTIRAWSSGNPRRIGNLYGRRLFYRLMNKVANRMFHN